MQNLYGTRLHPSGGGIVVATTRVEPVETVVDRAVLVEAGIRDAHVGERRCHLGDLVADMRSSDRLTTATELAGSEALCEDQEDADRVSGGAQVGIPLEVNAAEVREPAFSPDGLSGKETLASDGFVGRCRCKHFVSLKIMSGRR